MATPNYAFEKRQKELAKKQKQQQKKEQKAAIQSERSTNEGVVSATVSTTNVNR
jgi:hypothetical protein